MSAKLDEDTKVDLGCRVVELAREFGLTPARFRDFITSFMLEGDDSDD